MKRFKILVVTLILLSFQAISNDSVFMSLNSYYKLNETDPDKTDAYLSGFIAGETLNNTVLEKISSSKSIATEGCHNLKSVLKTF